MFWKKGEKNFNTRKNAIIIGSAGSGKCHHPWDDLKPCPCGCEERPLLMYEKDKLYCGGSTENVFAICSICGRHTEKSDMVTTINNWNNDKTKKDAKRDVPAFKDTALVTAISLSAPFDFPLSDYTNNSCCHSMRVLSD